jgi:hypothetical protein
VGLNVVDTARLRMEHKEIAAMARELIAIVDAPAPPEPLAFLRFRRDFGLILTRHLRHEEWAVYPALLDHRDPATRSMAAAVCKESMAFSEDIARYARDWTATRIAVEWEGFRGVTKAMMKRLLNRIDVEDNRLYPLLAKAVAAPASAPPSTRRFA